MAFSGFSQLKNKLQIIQRDPQLLTPAHLSSIFSQYDIPLIPGFSLTSDQLCHSLLHYHVFSDDIPSV